METLSDLIRLTRSLAQYPSSNATSVLIFPVGGLGYYLSSRTARIDTYCIVCLVQESSPAGSSSNCPTRIAPRCPSLESASSKCSSRLLKCHSLVDYANKTDQIEMPDVHFSDPSKGTCLN
jgi:hypothetical protein